MVYLIKEIIKTTVTNIDRLRAEIDDLIEVIK
jgi:hypothetical protein